MEPSRESPPPDLRGHRRRDPVFVGQFPNARFIHGERVNYWDTSALLKLYVAEPDSAYFLRLIEAAENPLHTSDVAKVEVLCALHRKERAGDLKPGAAAALLEKFLGDVAAGRIVCVPYGADTLSKSRELVRLLARCRSIRSLDLIHLAAASLVKAKVMVTTDERLREAATAAGLDVNP